MKNKKGEFIGEGLGLVLAILGIVILGFLGFKLYNLFVEQDMKNAKAFVEGLNSKIETLNDGENNTFALRGVEGWVLVAWNKDAPLKDKPEKCFDKNCLCLCKGKADNVTCQENGYCRGIDRNVSVKSILKERSSYMGHTKAIDYFSKCVFLYPELAGFLVSKNKTDVVINLDYGTLIDTNGKYSELIYRKGNKPPLFTDNICYLEPKVISPGYSGPSGGAPGG